LNLAKVSLNRKVNTALPISRIFSWLLDCWL